MNTPERDDMFRRYLNTCWAGGTKEQRQWAWDRYWDLEMADIQLQRKTEKRKRAEAVR